MFKQKHKQTGFTLIELMIAMVLGLILTGSLLTMLAQARKSFVQDENFASMQDEARYAMREISNDVSMAGFIGDIMFPHSVGLNAGLVIGDDCEDAAGNTFPFRLIDLPTGNDTSLMAADNITTAAAVAAFGCLQAGELVPGTDIVAVKRLAGSVATALAAGDVAVRYNGTEGELFVEPSAVAIPAPFEDRIYTPAIYFIRNYTDTVGDGIPSLCRKILVGGATVNMETECVAKGIEDLQVEYGIDDDEDGSVDFYLTAPTQAQLENTISARIFLLARTENIDVSHTDSKTYTLSNADDYTPGDSFRRRVFSTTVSINNVRHRKLTGIEI
jgi:prepilin-type N-terminal cleavage/methylation domain-containing protein